MDTALTVELRRALHAIISATPAAHIGALRNDWAQRDLLSFLSTSADTALASFICQPATHSLVSSRLHAQLATALAHAFGAPLPPCDPDDIRACLHTRTTTAARDCLLKGLSAAVDQQLAVEDAELVLVPTSAAAPMAIEAVLPPALLCTIFAYLDVHTTFTHAALVCRDWFAAAYSPAFARAVHDARACTFPHGSHDELRRLMAKWKSLTHFSGRGLDRAVVRGVASACTQLEHLALRACPGVDDAVLPSLVIAGPLQHLDLSENRGFSGPALAQALESASHALRSLSLRNCSALSAADIEACLQQCPDLTSLDLSGCAVHNRTLRPLRGSQLVRLAVTDCWNISEGVFNSALMHLPALVDLDLAGCVSVRDLHHLPHLRRLVLDRNRAIGDVELARLCHPHSELEHLQVEHCSVSDGGIIDCAPALRNLRVLKVSHNAHVGDAALLSIREHMPHVEELSVAGCTTLTNAGVEHLAGTPLKSLSLRGCYRITDAALATLLDQGALESLDLHGCMGVTGTAFSPGNITSLKEINLGRCSRLVGTAIATITQHAPQLSSLALADTLSITSSSLLHVRHCRALRHLSLSGCSNVGVDLLTDSLLPPLQSLSLQRCLWASDAALVAHLSSSGSRLASLNLHGCTAITDATVQDGIVPHCWNLQVLRLDHSLISDSALDALFELWQTHRRLELLHVEYCGRITQPAISRLRKVMRVVTTL